MEPLPQIIYLAPPTVPTIFESQQQSFLTLPKNLTPPPYTEQEQQIQEDYEPKSGNGETDPKGYLPRQPLRYKTSLLGVDNEETRISIMKYDCGLARLVESSLKPRDLRTGH